MKSNNAGARCSEIRHDAVDGFHHQVNVDRCGNTVVTQRLEHHWANGQIRNVMVIRNVEMDDISASCRASAVSSPGGQIGRQN